MSKEEKTRKEKKMNKCIENPNGRYRTVIGACGEINASRNTLMRVATEANAIVRFGRTIRIDMPVLIEYINSAYKTER